MHTTSESKEYNIDKMIYGETSITGKSILSVTFQISVENRKEIPIKGF